MKKSIKTSSKKIETKAKKVEEKPKKKVAKSQFTVSVFTERGAGSHKKIYESAGYKFVKSKITPDKVFLTFEDKE